MKVSAAKRWKRNQQKVYRKYNMKAKKFKRRRDLKGKFVMLQNKFNKNVVVVVRFTNRNLCTAIAAVRVNRHILKQTSSKFVISPGKKRKFFRKVEVIAEKRIKDEFKRALAESYKFRKHKKVKIEKSGDDQPTPNIKQEILPVQELQVTDPVVPVDLPERKVFEERIQLISTAPILSAAINAPSTPQSVKSLPRRITPIKILSCLKCNHKFTRKEDFELHLKAQHPNGINDSSDSESDLMIDEDVELVLDSHNSTGVTIIDHPVARTFDFKTEQTDITQVFPCAVCNMRFDDEQRLINHMGCAHSEPKFKCPKCSLVVDRELKLNAHIRMSHPVEVLEELPTSSKKTRKPRRKSVFPGSSTTSTPSTSRRASLDKPPEKVISFERFDSVKKKRFFCELCSSCYEKRELLDRHVSIRHVSKSYQCFVCRSFYANQFLMPHIRDAHGAMANDPNFIETMLNIEKLALYRCPFCIFTSKNRDRCCEHVQSEHYEDFEKNHHPENEQISSPDSLENLLTSESKDRLSDSEDPYLIEVFPKKPTQPTTSKTKDQGTPKHRCGKCKKYFTSPTRLKLHVCLRRTLPASSFQPKKASKSTPSPMMNGFYKCRSCPMVFTDKKMHSEHVSQMHEAKLP